MHFREELCVLVYGPISRLRIGLNLPARSSVHDFVAQQTEVVRLRDLAPDLALVFQITAFLLLSLAAVAFGLTLLFFNFAIQLRLLFVRLLLPQRLSVFFEEPLIFGPIEPEDVVSSQIAL